MVKVIIQHESGPLRGQVLEFVDNGQRIRIGRRADSQIRYPADLTEVGRLHAELAWKAGHLELKVNKRNPVYVDGSPKGATDGLELRDGAVVQLGVGPRLAIRYVRFDDMALTKDGSVKPVLDKAERLQKLETQKRLMLAAMTLLAMIGVAAFLYQRNEADRIVGSVQGIESKLGRFDSFEKAIERTKPSVYLVIARTVAGEETLGTAWVASEKYLATNAHVAQHVEAAREQEYVVVARSTTAPTVDLEITASTAHPGYQAYANEFARAEPLRTSAAGKESPLEYVGAYDVALLEVRNPDLLERPLAMVPRNRLDGIKAGLPVAYVGFPTEGLASKDTLEPTAISQVASIIGATTFTRLRATAGDGQLLEHSLPATGGASGSPIINVRGEVVGLLNGGNVVPLGGEFGLERTPSAAQVNFGQRVDVLMDLLEQGTWLSLTALRENWTNDFARYSRHAAGNKEAMVDEALQWWKANGAPDVVIDEVLSIRGNDEIQYLDHTLIGKGVRLTAVPGRYLVAASTTDAIDLDIVVTRHGVGQEDVIAEDSEPSRVSPPIVDFALESPTRLHAIVIAFPPESEVTPAARSQDPGKESVAGPDVSTQSLTKKTDVRLRVWRLPLEQEQE